MDPNEYIGRASVVGSRKGGGLGKGAAGAGFRLYRIVSRKGRSFLARLGWRSLRRALDSI
jgi:hypothetical protein